MTSSLESCKDQSTAQENKQAKVQIKTTHVSQAYLADYIDFSGRIIYLNKNSILAPISGYITKVNVNPGDRVKKGQSLFKMQSEEAYALKASHAGNENFGMIKIKAPANGTINELNVFKKAVYIDKGSSLCSLAETGSLYVQADVPFEFSSLVKLGQKCELILPDQTVYYSQFSKLLPQMNEQTQTLKILAPIKSELVLPEKMIVKVRVDRGKKEKMQVVPKNCLMTNSLMTDYWVMKLINDTTAVQVPVKIGTQTHTQVQIISPVFNSKDLIISEGAYGLSDTVLVQKIQ
jgi:multidrug efflux pump subunit AcrA (membrane-fusion protein)